MKRIMWTFGVGTPLKGKVVITHSKDFENAMRYVCEKYGQYNVAFNYIDGYSDINGMIEKYNYEIIEEVTL